MAKQTQTIRRQIAVELSVFDHFVGLALKGLILLQAFSISIINNLTVDFKEILFLFQKYWFRNDPIYE